MADRYLLESGAPDGYLLEDGSGVLLLNTALVWANVEDTTVTLQGDGEYRIVKTADVDNAYNAIAATTTAMSTAFRIRITPQGGGYITVGIGTATTGAWGTIVKYGLDFGPIGGGGTGTVYTAESGAQVLADNWDEGDIYWIDYDPTSATLTYKKGATYDAATTLLTPRTSVPAGSYYGLAYGYSLNATVDALMDAPTVNELLAGSSSLTFSTSAALVGQGALVGASTLTFAPTGALTATGPLAGASTLNFSSAGNLAGRGVLAGASTLAFSNAGALVGRGVLSGATTLIFAPAAILTGRGVLAGSSTLTFATAGIIAARGTLAGASSLIFSLSATLSGSAPELLSGSTSLTFTSSADLAAHGALSGSSSLTFAVTGDLEGVAAFSPLSGSVSFAFTLSGSLIGIPRWTEVEPESPAFANDNAAETVWTIIDPAEPDLTETQANSGTWTVTPASGGAWN